jgi:hypothetical protein
VTREDQDLGEIDHLTGQVVVQIDADVNALVDFQVVLEQYDPIWTVGPDVGAVRRSSLNGPFVIDGVPPGKYELTCYGPDRTQLRQIIELTRNSLQQQVHVRMPNGDASLSGKIDERLRETRGIRALKVWREDNRWMRYLVLGDDGAYRLEGLPAGNYLIRDKDTRDAPVLLTVALQEGEQRTLDFTPENVSLDQPRLGFLEVFPYTSAGVPIPCQVQLNGPDGTLEPHSSQYGRVTFVGPPGAYTLSASHPGFAPSNREVDLQPIDKDGRAQGDFSVQVVLEEID